MKKLISIIFAVIMACSVLLFGCNSNETEQTETTEYTIMYNDGVSNHTLKVKSGDVYEIEQPLPSKTGYDFIGLYDAEVGGTQYVSANGSSLAPYTDKRNIVLFPQYKAKEYTVVLDYQGVAVTGSRQFTVEYGSSLPELPKNLTGDHKEFVGWYTAAECGGTQIADEYGLIPLVSVLNEQNFDLSSSSITLYAGFEMEKHTVTFCFEAGMDTEEVQVAYDTPISQIVPNTRVEGNAVLNWSKTQGGNPWNGKVTSDMVLYAVEYAPVIEFDSNGGNEITPVVARAGSTIALPTPTKDLAKFSHWEDMQGNVYEETTMPAKSTTLKAVWQAKLVFDENGGSDVNDISQKAGTSIELPTPEKEGFIFAGWYTADKEQYTSTSMPVVGIKLKAGYYKTKSKKVILIKDDDSTSFVYKNTPVIYNSISLTEEISEVDWAVSHNIKILCYADVKHGIKGSYDKYWSNWDVYASKEHFYFYSSSQISDANLLGKITLDHGQGKIVENFTALKFTIELTTTTGVIEIAFSADKNCDAYDAAQRAGWFITNFWAEIQYPDTTNLYL